MHPGEADHREEEAGRGPAVPERNLGTRLAGQPGFMRAAGLQGDLRPGVPHPHHQDGTGLELGRVLVAVGVELHDVGRQFRRKARRLGQLAGAGGEDNVRRRPALRPGRDMEPLPVVAQPGDGRVGPDRQVEPGGIVLQIVRLLVLGGEGEAVAGEGPAGQAVVLGGGEQAQRVPAAPPRVANPCAGVENDKVPVLLRQVVAQRQAGLSGTDDDGVDGGSTDGAVGVSCWGGVHGGASLVLHVQLGAYERSGSAGTSRALSSMGR